MHVRNPCTASAMVTKCALFIGGLAALLFARPSQLLTPDPARIMSSPLPECAPCDELVLPKSRREWISAGSPVTPDAFNENQALEYHTVRIEPRAYAIYKMIGVYPEGAITLKEIQLTAKPTGNADGEPHGRGE